MMRGRLLSTIGAMIATAAVCGSVAASSASAADPPQMWEGTIGWNFSCSDCYPGYHFSYTPIQPSRSDYSESGSITLTGTGYRNTWGTHLCPNEFFQDFTWEVSYSHAGQWYREGTEPLEKWSETASGESSGSSIRPYLICVDEAYNPDFTVDPSRSVLHLGNSENSCQDYVHPRADGAIAGACPGTYELWLSRILLGWNLGYEQCEEFLCWPAERPEKIDYELHESTGRDVYGEASLVLPNEVFTLGTSTPKELSGEQPFHVTSLPGGDLKGTLDWDLTGAPEISYPPSPYRGQDAKKKPTPMPVEDGDNDPTGRKKRGKESQVGMVCGKAKFDFHALNVAQEDDFVDEGDRACMLALSNQATLELGGLAVFSSSLIMERFGTLIRDQLGDRTAEAEARRLRKQLVLKYLKKALGAIGSGISKANAIVNVGKGIAMLMIPYAASVHYRHVTQFHGCTRILLATDGGKLRLGGGLLYSPDGLNDPRQDVALTRASVWKQKERRLRPDLWTRAASGLSCTTEGNIELKPGANEMFSSARFTAVGG